MLADEKKVITTNYKLLSEHFKLLHKITKKI